MTSTERRVCQHCGTYEGDADSECSRDGDDCVWIMDRRKGPQVQRSEAAHPDIVVGQPEVYLRPAKATCVVCLAPGLAREPVCPGCIQIAGDLLKTEPRQRRHVATPTRGDADRVTSHWIGVPVMPGRPNACPECGMSDEHKLRCGRRTGEATSVKSAESFTSSASGECKHDDPLVIDSYTAWCPPCGALFAMKTWRLPEGQRRESPQPPEFPPSWEREIPVGNDEKGKARVTARKGNWMQTIGGRAFYPLDPRPEEIDIQDIAHALAHVCRFGGHCKAFYSVAEHCVRVSEAIRGAGGTVAEQFEGLMHDSAEAYVGDMVWPLKQAEDVSGYKRVERLVEAAIAERFGLPHEQSPIVKKFDLVLLSTEKRDLMMDGVGREDGSKRESAAAKAKLGAWHCDEFKALPDRIEAWMPTTARLRFLDLFFDLRGVR